MHRILIIDDDILFCQLLSRYLIIEGFGFDICNDETQAETLAIKQEYDLILLDLMFPTKSGFDILKALRTVSNVPVIMLSSIGDDINKIVGLECGADAYIKKGSNPRVIIAKINSVIRRADDNFSIIQSKSRITLNNVILDLNDRTLHIENNKIELTVSEFEVLEYLIKHKERAVSKEELLKNVLGKKITSYDRSIDTHIFRLRAKIKVISNEKIIKTIQGFGYQFNTHD